MSKLSVADKTLLESVLGMSGGHVLDFTNTSFAQFFDHLGIDIYDEKYAEYGVSKANRLRTFWKLDSDGDIASSLDALADYVAARKVVGGCEEVTDEQISTLRGICRDWTGTQPSPAAGGVVLATTEASVTKNLISIEIHEDIYSHIEQYLASGDHFHAVEESYKVVREKLRELAGSERATDVFNENAQSNKHYAALFGRATPANSAEADFFRGIGYLHLGVQFLRNEKAHTLATFVEPNLAIHYISLASLAYDLITRYVSEDFVREIEEIVAAKRDSYRTATAFYRDFEGGQWLASLTLPSQMRSSAVRKALRAKWLDEADLTMSYDHSNLIFMRLELIVDELTSTDIDRLLGLPTKDSYGNAQAAGIEEFMEFIQQIHPDRLSPKAKAWIEHQQEAGR